MRYMKTLIHGWWTAPLKRESQVFNSLNVTGDASPPFKIGFNVLQL